METTDLDNDGRPVVALPPQKSWAQTLQRAYFRYVLVPFMAPFFIAFKTIRDPKFRNDVFHIYGIVEGSVRIQNQPYYQQPDLIAKLWQQPSSQQYIQNKALEYQNSEGYCGRATLRCILKSLGVPASMIPPTKRAETKPEKWCDDIQQLVQDSEDQVLLGTEIVRGDVPYAEFLRTLERLEASPDTTRIALNYLRPALFGFTWPKFFVTNLILGLFGGHFSPVVGIVRENQPKDNPLIGVFDVNHSYKGAYLVPAQTLHTAVKARDVTNSKSRALVVVTKKK